jgi:hypothetical protein
LLAVVIACLVLQSPSVASGAPKAADDAVDVKGRIAVLPPGSALEVKLTNEEELKGKLGPFDHEGFELRISQKRTIRARKVAYTEVRSMRLKRGMSTGAKIGLGVGIFTAVAVLVTGLVLGAIGRNE